MSRYYLRQPEFRVPNLWGGYSDLEGQMNRVLRESRETGFPGLNVYADENEIIVSGEIPGVDSDDLNLSVENDILSIRFERKNEVPEKSEVLRKERPSGNYSRDLKLPYRVNGEGVDASVKNGMLHVVLPRAEEDKPKKITVKAS